MIEQGIVMLVNGGLSSPPSTIGGYFAELPEGTLTGWTYISAGQVTGGTLTSASGLDMRRLQIDVYAPTPEAVIALAASISTILNGYAGNLPDPDNTFVSSCFLTNVMDFFDEASRSYRRMIEFEINYAS